MDGMDRNGLRLMDNGRGACPCPVRVLSVSRPWAFHSQCGEDGFWGAWVDPHCAFEHAFQTDAGYQIAVRDRFSSLDGFEQGLVCSFAGEDFADFPVDHRVMQLDEGERVSEEAAC